MLHQNSSEKSVCVAVKMIRRGGGRTPPVILIGLLVMLVILGFNYWLVSSQNADLQQELEKLQAEVKIRLVESDESRGGYSGSSYCWPVRDTFHPLTFII